MFVYTFVRGQELGKLCDYKKVAIFCCGLNRVPMKIEKLNVFYEQIIYIIQMAKKLS